MLPVCWVGGACTGQIRWYLRGIRSGHWGGRVGFGGGCTACAGDVCVRGDWFLPVKSVADKFLVFTHCLSGFWLVWIGFSVRLRFSVWVAWLFRG